MLIIPTQAVPNQSINVGLGNQLCKINIYQKTTGLFLDLFVNNTAVIVTGAICLNLVKLVRSAYLGFIGDLAFLDTQAGNDPVYTGLGSRYLLTYFSPADLGQTTPSSTPSAGGGGGVSPPASSPRGIIATGQFTLSPNVTSTVVTCAPCVFGAVVLYDPITQDAANDAATMSYAAANGSFTITHANNARTDRTFRYVVIFLG